MNLNALRGVRQFAEKLSAGPIKDANIRKAFLLPKGLEESRTSVMPKERRKCDFTNWKMVLKRPEKEVESNVVVFETELHATKPEIKQYLEKIYGLNVLKVNTAIQMGKFKRAQTNKLTRKLCANHRILQAA